MNKIIIIILVIALIGISYFTFFNSPDETPIAMDAPIVAFGDSLTYGYGSTKGNDYVSVLSRMIERPIVNLGVNGDTTGDALKRVSSVTKLKPGLVIVFLGGNDLLRRVNIEETFSNLDAIVSTTTASGAKVVLVAVPGSIFGDPYEKRFKDIAKKYDAKYVPQFISRIIANDDLIFDAIHPNDAGYKIVAEKIYDAIKGII